MVLAGPADDTELGALTGIDGVAAVERVAALPVTLVAGDERYATTLRGFRADTSMHRFTGLDGTRTTLPGNGVLLGAALEEQLDVAAGDRVELLDDRGSRIGTVDVHGFVDEPLGSPAYASLDTFGRLAPDQPVGIVALRFDAGADPSAVVDRLQARDEVLAVSRTGALRDAVEQFMGLFYAFVGAMLVCGGLLAFGILFTTMSVNLAERTVETATLRASGVSRRRLARLITAENLLVTVLGIAPGLVLGWLAAGQALSAYSSDMFRLELAMSPLTFVLAAGGIMVAALASQVPGLRAMRRTDIASVVRERTA